MSTNSHGELRARLGAEGCFSSATIDAVANTAALQQASPTYQDFFNTIGLSAPQFVRKGKSGVSVVDCAAQTKPQVGVLVVHLPMGNPLDTNQLFQVATIAATNPSYRVIAFGNPSGGRYAFSGQNLTHSDRRSIAGGTHVQPLVAAEIAYLQSQDIQHVSHAGFSFGALKSVIAAYYSGDITVDTLVTIEPVAHPRGLKQLIGDFLRTDGPLNTYVNRAKVPIFIEARRAAVNGRDYKRGLFRPINIAIARLLSRADFIEWLTKAMVRHPHMKVTLAWASKSELGNDAHFKSSSHHLGLAMPGRFRAMRFAEAHHALANDVHLHAAIIREGLTG